MLRPVESSNSSPVPIDALFRNVILLRRCDHLPPIDKGYLTFPAVAARDLRSARRFAFQFDLGIVNGEVNVSRANGTMTISILVFFPREVNFH